MIGRHRQVIGRGHALEDPAGEIVFRAVARAEEAAEPVRRRIGRVGFGSYSGTQPRWVQMPTTTRNSGLIERLQFLAYSGCCQLSELGSRSCDSSFGSRSVSSAAFGRRTTNTGRAAHSVTSRWPSWIWRHVDVDRPGRRDRRCVRIHLVDERPDGGGGPDRRDRSGHEIEQSSPARRRLDRASYRADRLGRNRASIDMPSSLRHHLKIAPLSASVERIYGPSGSPGNLRLRAARSRSARFRNRSSARRPW